MNKRYLFFTILLLVNNIFFSMQKNVVKYMMGPALVGSSYLLDKECSRYQETSLENLPSVVETWARKNLVDKKIKNADLISLKKDSCWITRISGSAIGLEQNEVQELEVSLLKQNMEAEDKKKEIFAREMLLHEAWHYQNNDNVKRYIFQGLTTGLLFFKNVNVPIFMLKLAMVAASNIAYIRYQEKEADRFAFMNVLPEDLEVCKCRRLEWAELFEEHTLDDPLLNQHSWIGKRAGLLIAKRLYDLNQKALKYSDDSDESLHIQSQKKVLIGLADFLHDTHHLTYRQQVALVQECMDKRGVKSLTNHQ